MSEMTEAAPVVNQPKIRSPISGLETLDELDQFLVEQEGELFEMRTGIEAQNRYVIKDSTGKQIYLAHESTQLCMLICGGSTRGFTFNIYDNNRRLVARIFREWRCCQGCCWCATIDSHCAWAVRVEAPPGNVVGYIRQGQSVFNPVYYVCDANKEDMLICTRHCCMCQYCCCTDDLDFNIYNIREDGRYDQCGKYDRVGWVAKEWGGFIKEHCTKLTNFSVHWALANTMKLMMLALTLQLEFHYFECDKTISCLW